MIGVLLFDGAWRCELTAPWSALALPGGLLLWWLLAGRRVLEVPSTFVWRRVATGRTVQRAAAPWICLIALTLCATRPVVIAPIPTAPPGVHLTVHGDDGGGGWRVEALVEPGAGPGELWLSLAGRATVDGAPDRRVPITAELHEHARFAWTVPESTHAPQSRQWRLAPDRRLRVLEASWRVPSPDASSRRWQLQVPALAAPPVVHDLSGSPAMAQALAALAAEGVIAISPKDAPPPAGTADLVVTTDPTMRARGLLLPTHDAPPVVPLPAPLPSTARALAGLDVTRWSILSATTPRLGQGAPLLESRQGPLIQRVGERIEMTFAVEQSDLAARADWPVLIGRLLLELAEPAPRPHAPRGAPSPWPAWLSGGVAILALWRTGGSARLRMLLTLAVTVALLLPATLHVPGWGAPTTRPLLDPGDEASWRRAMAHLPGGGRLTFDGHARLPVDTTTLQAECAVRRIGLAVRPPPRLVIRPQVALLGEPIELSVVDPPHPGARSTAFPATPTARPAVQSGSARPLGLYTSGPDGHWQEVDPSAPGSWRHHPQAPGTWHYVLRELAPAPPHIAPAEALSPSAPRQALASGAITVRAPAQSLVLGNAGVLRALAEHSSFRIHEPAPGTPWGWPALPGGVVLWDGHDPAALSADEHAALIGWVEAGGVLLTTAGPPFLEPSEARRRWENELLPAILPDPPRRRDRALGIILVDLSRSVAGEALDAALRGARELLETTPEGGRWGVAFFRDQPGWIAPPGSRVDLGLIERLAALEARGGTRLDRALAFAREALTPAEHGRQLVLLTDGRTPDLDAQVEGAALAADDIELLIVGLGAAPDAVLLAQLADAAGGRFERATSPMAAAMLLSGAVRGAPDSGSEGSGPATVLPVRPLALHPLTARWPRELPAAPLRLQAVQPLPGALALVSDAHGQPLLLLRERGRGASLLWTGEPSSLPASQRRTAELLVTTLLARTQPPSRAHRLVDWRRARDGTPRVIWDRFPGEPGLRTRLSPAAPQEGESWFWDVGEGYQLHLSEAVREIAMAPPPADHALPIPSVAPEIVPLAPPPGDRFERWQELAALLENGVPGGRRIPAGEALLVGCLLTYLLWITGRWPLGSPSPQGAAQVSASGVGSTPATGNGGSGGAPDVNR